MRKPPGYGSRVRGLLAAIVILFSGVVPAIGQGAQAQAIDLPDCAERRKDVKKYYPVLETDLFDVVYIDGCLLSKIWDDTGTGKSQNVSIWEPDWKTLGKAGYMDGFYSPGMFLTPHLTLTGSRESYATFIFKPKHPDLIRPNSGHEPVWSDEKSGAKTDVSVWEPKCISGFASLGLEAVAGYSAPTSSKVACVSKHHSYQMDVYKPGLDENGSFWSSSGTKAKHIAFFSVQGGGRVTLTNRALLPPPTFWAKKDSFDPPSLDKFRGLLVLIQPSRLLGHPGQTPKLKEPSVADFKASSDSTTEKGYSISALLVQDPFYDNTVARLLASPEYYIHITTSWKPVDGGISCPWGAPENCEYGYTVVKGVSEATTWNNSLGVAVSAQMELETSVKPLGIGTGAKFTLGIETSYSHEFGGESSTSTEVGTERTFSVRPGSFAVAFQPTSTFEVYRYNDKTRNPNNLVRPSYQASPERSAVYLATYLLPKEYPAGCDEVHNRNLVTCGLPVANIPSLPPNTRIYSESKNHYLILTNGGTLEVREKGVGLNQHSHAWSLDQKHLHGTYGHTISSVSFSGGRLHVEAAGLEPWLSDAPDPQDSDKITHLDIDEEGNLRVVTENGDVIWNSKHDS